MPRKVHKHLEVRCPNCNRLVIANSRNILDCQSCVPIRMQSLLDPQQQRQQHQGPKTQSTSPPKPIQPKTTPIVQTTSA